MVFLSLKRFFLFEELRQPETDIVREIKRKKEIRFIEMVKAEFNEVLIARPGIPAEIKQFFSSKIKNEGRENETINFGEKTLTTLLNV